MQQQHQARTIKQCMNLELFKSQLWDDFGVPAAVFPVGVVREEGVLHCALVHTVRGGVHPLHLVEHNTLACDVILHIKPCWFLHEHVASAYCHRVMCEQLSEWHISRPV